MEKELGSGYRVDESALINLKEEAERLKIDNHKLSEYFDFYKDAFKAGIKKEKIEEEFLKTHRENIKEFHEFHNSILELTKIIEEKSGGFDKWLADLSRTLRNSEERVEQFSTAEKAHINTKGKELLEKYNFDFNRNEELEKILVSHPADLYKIAKVSGDAAYLFQYSLPVIKDLITKERWPDIVKMAETSGSNVCYLFEDGLPAIKDLITEENWPMFVEGLSKMAKASGENAYLIFQYSLPVIKDLITKERWPDIVKMAEASGKNATYLFNVLPKIKDLINEKTWPMFVEGLPKMAEASGENASPLFEYGLPAIKDLINEKTWPMFVEDLPKMAEASRENAWALFQYGLPTIKDLITEENWPMFVRDLPKIAEAFGENSSFFFKVSLPAIKDLITKENWPMFAEGFIKMAKASGKNVSNIIDFGLPAIKDLINEENWPMFVEDLPKMAEASRENAYPLFHFGIPAIKDLINEENWPMFVRDLPKMAEASGKNAGELFQYGLPAIKDLITEENWEHYLKFFLYVGRSKQRTNNLVNLSEIIQPHEKQLLSYLITNAHTTALDTISKSELLSFLDVNFEHEMNMFMKIALPMFIKENPASQETMLTPLSKLKETKPKAYDEYLEILNKSLITFQDAKYNFLQVLEASGFKNVEEYSFAELGYIYLRYAGKPNLKLKKLTKGLRNLKGDLTGLLNAPTRKNSEVIKYFTQSIDNSDLRKLMLIPLFKLKETKPEAYNEYFKILRGSSFSFECEKYNFLKVLEASGFKNVEEYSFAELGYIYSKYARTPNLNPTKLIKNMKKKLEKEGKNIIDLLTKLIQEDSKTIHDSTKNIIKAFYEPAVGLYKNTADSKIRDKLESTFKVSIKDLDQKIEDIDLLNALRFYGKSKNVKPLIQNYLQNKTYPLTKNILESYPYNLPQNRDWIKKNLKNDVWLKEFERDFRLITEDLKDTNFKDRIKHHFEVAEGLIKKLKLSIKRIDLPTLEKLYKLIEKEKKYDQTSLGELNNEIQAIKSIEGQEERLNKKLREKVIITQELNPMSALQMGNHVGGSCLNINGSNYWSALVNATEVNKRILWAKEADGTIIARVLIAVDSNKNIIRFPTYYATNVPLDRFFNEYIKELAEKCGFGINGDPSEVEHLGSEEWYLDPEVSI